MPLAKPIETAGVLIQAHCIMRNKPQDQMGDNQRGKGVGSADTENYWESQGI